MGNILTTIWHSIQLALINMWWICVICIIAVNQTIAQTTLKAPEVSSTLRQLMAERNMFIVQQFSPFWVESLTLIIIAVITAVVAPVVTLWARKKFSTV